MWLRRIRRQFGVAAAACSAAVLLLLLMVVLPSCDTATRFEKDRVSLSVAQSCDSCLFSLVPAPYITFGGAIPADAPLIDSAVVMQIGAGRMEEDSVVQRTFMKQLLQKFPGVTLVDDSIRDSYLVFKKHSGMNYIVKTATLYEWQGWLLFTPEKYPVYCTSETVLMSCNDSTLVSCYFGN